MEPTTDALGRLRAELGAVPAVVADVGDPATRQWLAEVLCRGYLDNRLPRPFVDGTFLVMAAAMEWDYPLHLHAARLMAAGVAADDVAVWRALAPLPPVTVLSSRWRARSPSGPFREHLGDPSNHSTALLVQTAAACSLDVRASGELHVRLASALADDLLLDLWRIAQVWTALSPSYSTSASAPAQGPLIEPWLDAVEAALARPVADKEAPRLLLVEDNDVVRLLCTEVLSAAGYEVTGAATATEAREAGLGWDLALVDVQLPDGYGVDLAGELGARRVVFMSGTESDDVRRFLKESGPGWSFVRKPFQVPELLEAVEGALSREV